jgi:hypothetical protein
MQQTGYKIKNTYNISLSLSLSPGVSLFDWLGSKAMDANGGNGFGVESNASAVHGGMAMAWQWHGGQMSGGSSCAAAPPPVQQPAMDSLAWSSTVSPSTGAATAASGAGFLLPPAAVRGGFGSFPVNSGGIVEPAGDCSSESKKRRSDEVHTHLLPVSSHRSKHS